MEKLKSINLQRNNVKNKQISLLKTLLKTCWIVESVAICTKPFVQLYVENLLKVLKVLKTVIKGSPASEAGKSRHALRTAHRAYRMTFEA